jgi:HD-GYP domain-containing protein (c-di-GMP phosphodiesterase class II)
LWDLSVIINKKERIQNKAKVPRCKNVKPLIKFHLVHDHILKKPGKLTDEEWTIMKSHTTNGYQILRSADQYSSLADYSLTHHERYDGKGYPQGLKGEDIPLYSRIIGICDAYEAMTADRPYRKALTKEVAIAELKRCSGTQFDPRLVEVFINEVVSNVVL